MAVGGSVAVGGRGVLVSGIGVAVAGTGVLVGETSVAVAGIGVDVAADAQLASRLKRRVKRANMLNFFIRFSFLDR